MLTSHGNANVASQADAGRALRVLKLLTDAQSKGGTGLVNVRWYGAVGDGIVDDTVAIQNAINDQVGKKDATGIYLPPGKYRVTRTLLVGLARGFRMQGSGAYVGDAGAAQWSVIIADGMSGLPVLDLFGTAGFHLSDFGIRGNAADSLTGAAKYGIRLRSPAGAGSGVGFSENVSVYWCDEAINFGKDGITANAADCTFMRCSVLWCRVAFRSEHSQALNISFYDFSAGFCDDVFQLVGGNIFVSMLATYDVKRVVYVEEGGGNIGHTTIVNARLDGASYRAVVYETGTNTSVTWATLMDVHVVSGGPSTGTARIKLTHDNLVKVIGGANLCGTDGPLFDLDGTGGVCSILVEGAELPDDPTKVVGTITGTGKYRIRNCFSDLFNSRTFITDYAN